MPNWITSESPTIRPEPRSLLPTTPFGDWEPLFRTAEHIGVAAKVRQPQGSDGVAL
jgi:hypothetical protein